MQTTTNYGYNVVESTDTCNIPVQISPNFTDIDTDLKAVSDKALGEAVDTFASNVHALVRNDADRNMFFFIAPADYVAGDTFTLDGVTINAVDAAGNALDDDAFRVNSTVLCIVYGSRLTLYVDEQIASLTAANITYDNTISGLTATDVQNAIDELASGLSTVASDVSDIGTALTSLLTGTIAAGATSVTISDASITTNSIIDIYFKDKVLSPTNVTVTTGAITIEIDAESDATYVGVRVLNA